MEAAEDVVKETTSQTSAFHGGVEHKPDEDRGLEVNQARAMETAPESNDQDQSPGQSSRPPDLEEDSQNNKPSRPSPSLVSEIQSLEERLLQLRWQAAAEADSSGERAHDPAVDDDTLRKQIRKKTRFGQEWVNKIEKSAEESLSELHHFRQVSGIDNPNYDRFMHSIRDMGKNPEYGPVEDEFNGGIGIEPEQEFNAWLHLINHPRRGPRGLRPMTSLRPIYSRKVGPPSQWDTADGDDWSSDDSISSRDFDYFRARLRGDFEWELDRLNHQRGRYKKHQERKRATEIAAKVEEERERMEEEHKERQASGNEQQNNDAVVQMNSLAWENFKAARNTPTRLSCVIDILMGEPDISKGTFWGYFGATNKPGPSVSVKSKPQVANLSHYDGVGVLPERIRIHSKQLIKALSTVHGSELRPLEDDSETEPYSMVMLRPYRMLTYYDKELRNCHEQLAKDILRPESTTDSVGVPDAVTPLEEVTLSEATGMYLSRIIVFYAPKYANNLLITRRRCWNGRWKWPPGNANQRRRPRWLHEVGCDSQALEVFV